MTSYYSILSETVSPLSNAECGIESLHLRRLYMESQMDTTLKCHELLEGCWLAEILMDNCLREDYRYGLPEPWRIEILAEDRKNLLGFVGMEILTCAGNHKSTLQHHWEKEDSDVTQILASIPEHFFSQIHRIGLLLDIWIEPKHRRMGLGSYLFQYVLSRLRQDDLFAVYVWGDMDGISMSELIRFYETSLSNNKMDCIHHTSTHAGLFMMAKNGVGHSPADHPIPPLSNPL